MNRRFRSTVFFVPFVLLLFSCGQQVSKMDPEPKPSEFLEGRNLAEYDAGGSFWCHLRSNEGTGNEGDPMRGERTVRDFIWQHWTEKRKGYIIFNCGGIDTSYTSHSFIEPNANGDWVVHDRSVSRQSDGTKAMTSSDMTSVKKIGPRKKGDEWVIEISGEGETTYTIPYF
jgi:hypothetical protein